MKILSTTIIMVMLIANIYSQDINIENIDNIKIPDEEFYGEWVVEKDVTPNWIPGIYGKEDVDKMIGKKIVYSKDIASYDDNICKNPFYKKTIVPDDRLIDMHLIFYRNIGMNVEEATIVEIYEDKEFTNNWAGDVADSFIIKDENTLIAIHVAKFLELKRIK